MNKTYETKLNEPSKESLALPWFHSLPTDKPGLLRWRIYVRERCLHDDEFRAAIVQMCAEDAAFFIATFGVWHETRLGQKELGRFVPMLDPDQVDILAWWQKYTGTIDITVEKTRGIGLSYLAVSFSMWLWLFRGHGIEIGLLSKDDTSLDVPNRPSSLMGKLDLFYKELPAWIQSANPVRRTHSMHRFENLANGALIQGYTATDQKLRSARLYCLFVDEAAFLPTDVQRWLAAAQGTTPSIVYISTHNGSATMFYRLTRNHKDDLVRISTFWWNNRRCAAGLYVVNLGEVKLLDEGYKYDPDYEFVREFQGHFRSPWVDKAFRRAGASSQTVFEELYGIAAITTRKLFRPEIMDRAEMGCMQPVMRAFMDQHGLDIDDLEGDFYFYDSNATSQYVIGVDPALGSKGGAYAGVCVIDCQTGLQVASARLAAAPPVELAELVYYLADYFAAGRPKGYVTIAYESTGIGGSFGSEIERLGWPCIARQEGKKTPGLHNKDRGEAWLVELSRAIRDGDILIRDERIVDECRNFEYDSKFELNYASGDGHGDLAIATGAAWSVAKHRRKAVRAKEQDAYNSKRGIEAEPLYRQRHEMNDLWSRRWQ